MRFCLSSLREIFENQQENTTLTVIYLGSAACQPSLTQPKLGPFSPLSTGVKQTTAEAPREARGAYGANFTLEPTTHDRSGSSITSY